MATWIADLGKSALEKVKGLFKEKPPPQQPCQILIRADELTAKNLQVGLVFGMPNGSPSVLVQTSPPKQPDQINDKKQ